MGEKYLVLSEEKMQNLSQLGLNISDASKSFGGYGRYTLNEVDLRARELMSHSNISTISVHVDEHGVAMISIEIGKEDSTVRALNIRASVDFVSLDLYYMILVHILSSWKTGDVLFDVNVFNEMNLLRQ